MANLEISLPAVDGSLYSLHEFGESCKLAIQTIAGDDFAAPPKHMVIEVKTDSGKTVQLFIPYEHGINASVVVDDQKL